MLVPILTNRVGLLRTTMRRQRIFPSGKFQATGIDRTRRAGRLTLLICTLFLGQAGLCVDSETLFARTNLAAWCIVPFDAKKRGPEERAAMLERLLKSRAIDQSSVRRSKRDGRPALRSRARSDGGRMLRQAG